MIIGNIKLFALESEVTQAYERLSLRALGFFVIHIAGQHYGSMSEDATMLALAFDGVGRRIACQGRHNAPAISDAEARTVAIAFSRAVYSNHPAEELFFGMLDFQFKDLLYSNDIVWAPDGEEGFDDGSCVLQFDVGNMVRLIAFRRAMNPLLDPDSLRDVWLPQDDFYRILQGWYEGFENEWKSLPKQCDSDH